MIRSASILVGLVLLSTVGVAQSSLDVMTYNLRYATDRDGENAWSKRKLDVAALIDYYAPAILGVQEAVAEQMSYLDSTFVQYAFVGVGRDDGATAGEYSAIFYDTSLLKCIASETFWLSETPSVPSFGWGANYRRVCTYGSFVARSSGDTFQVFNTHFDHEIELARLNGALVILEKAEKLLADQVILMGDFNCLASDPPMQKLATVFDFAAQRSASLAYGPTSTFTGFEPGLKPGRLIDHIMTLNLKVASYRNIDDRRPNGRWPSDHLPVLTTVSSL